jgi:hypothetical protein
VLGLGRKAQPTFRQMVGLQFLDTVRRPLPAMNPGQLLDKEVIGWQQGMLRGKAAQYGNGDAVYPFQSGKNAVAVPQQLSQFPTLPTRLTVR